MVARVQKTTNKKSKRKNSEEKEQLNISPVSPVNTGIETQDSEGGANAPTVKSEDREVVVNTTTEQKQKFEPLDLGQPAEKLKLESGEIMDWSLDQRITLKHWVFEQEKHNFDKIYLFRSHSQKAIRWWKMGVIVHNQSPPI